MFKHVLNRKTELILSWKESGMLWPVIRNRKYQKVNVKSYEGKINLMNMNASAHGLLKTSRDNFVGRREDGVEIYRFER